MGTEEEEVHIHIHVGGDQAVIDTLAVISDRLNSMEQRMTDTNDALNAQTAAIGDMVTRINEDFAEAQRLLDQALATDVADQATIDDLKAQMAALLAGVQSNTAALTAINPNPDFPAATPPADQPPA